jgi:hypothetical protein
MGCRAVKKLLWFDVHRAESIGAGFTELVIT